MIVEERYSAVMNGTKSNAEKFLHREIQHEATPTSMTLTAALLLLDSPLNNDEDPLPQYVYLLSRPYLQNWVYWAYFEPAPPDELDRIRSALRMAAELHGLDPLPAPKQSPSKRAERHSWSTESKANRPLSEHNISVNTSAVPELNEEGIEFHNPGPIDSTSLSLWGHPLLLRPNVVVGKGDKDDATSLRESPRRKAAMRRSSSVNNSVEVRVGCCAVSEPFYEFLRSVHGVVCDDGVSVSFQPPVEQETAALHHHIVSSSPLSPQKSKYVGTANISHPHSGSVSNQYRKKESASGGVSSMQTPKPVEFRRVVVLAPKAPDGKHIMDTRVNGGTTNAEVLQRIVEVNPMKIFYSVIDDSTNGSQPGSPLRRMDSKSSRSLPNGTDETSDLLKAASDKLDAGSKASERAPASSSPRRPRVSSGPLEQVPQPVNSEFPHVGFVLISRITSAANALIAVQKAAAPEKSSRCLRLWVKTRTSISGDGYELIDMDALLTSNPDIQISSITDWVRQNIGQLNSKSLELLVEIRSSPSVKWPRESMELENRIKVGDFVDAQDSTGKYYEAIVREVHDTYVWVHYIGWSSRWNCRIKRRKNSGEIGGTLKNASAPCPLWTRTSRWRDEIKVGDEVEVREVASLVNKPKWFRGVVRKLGKESDPVRDLKGGAELEALEKENGKKRPLVMFNRKRQVLVEVPQERNVSNSSPRTWADPSTEAQPPAVRWVNLYGEEICVCGTHLKKSSERAAATASYAYDTSRPPVEVLKPYSTLHGSGFVRESLRGVPAAPGSVGLHNLGNSCFLNSIVQCMNHIDPLTQYFLKGDYKKEINYNNPLGSGGMVATAYAALLNEMWSGDYSTLAPRTLKKTVASFAPQFNNHYQHDSQEFCQFLMDGIHEDLNRVREKPYVEDLEGLGMKDHVAAIESWRKHLLRHDSIMVDTCQGMHRSHVTCPQCGKESIKFDVYSTISLPLAQRKNRPCIPLTDCLDQFTAGEQLDDNNAWYCPGCKKHVCALKMISLWTTPDILVLHLKRFKFDNHRNGGIVRTKVEDTVDFPIDGLDMSPYILGPKDEDAPPVYNLFGVSEHSGSTANSGHYTATVRNSRDGNWYRFNDSHVGMSSGEAAVTSGAYLLFYRRSKGSARWGGMEKAAREHDANASRPDTDAEGFTQVKSKKRRGKHN